MATRVGGPPRGPPPAIIKPGKAPKGAPPGGKLSKQDTRKGKAGAATGGGGASSASSNANIPKAPPVAHYICFIKGEPFTNAAAADVPKESDDLDLDAAADIANMSALVDGLGGGGGSEPFKVDESPSESQPSPAQVPPDQDMSNPNSLAAMLQAQALKLKKAEDAPPLAPPKEKSESEMSFAELIAWKS